MIPKQLEGATLDGNLRNLHQILKSMNPWKPKRYFRLVDFGGIPARGYTTARKLVADLFAGILDAKPTDFVQFVGDERKSAVDDTFAVAHIVRDIKLVPTSLG